MVSITVATLFGINSIRDLVNSNSEKMLTMLCETGEKNLDHYFESMEQSVVKVASFAEADLDTIELSHLGEHVERTKNVFNKIAENTNGVLTYYYRIDPEVSRDVDGFWYIDIDEKEYINELNVLNQKLKDDNLTLEAATIRDSLTGVKNRFALRRDYDGYTEQDIHIMMLDIDDFKKVNDNYGHSVGDYLLKKTGDTLIDLFGAEHSYRYGGDEFMVIFPDIQESDFKGLINDMVLRLEEIYLDCPCISRRDMFTERSFCMTTSD